MRNTDRFFSAVKSYAVRHIEAEQEYRKSMEKLAGYEGSDRYMQEMKAAADRRDEVIGAARSAASVEIKAALNAMKESLSGIPMVAPTQEMLATMQMIREKETRGLLTEDDVNRAAVSFSGNTDMMDILFSISQKKGFILHNISSEKMDAATAGNVIEALGRNSTKMLNGDTSARYAVNIPTFVDADKTEIISRMGGLPNKLISHSTGVQDVSFDESLVNAFSMIVDGEA